MPEIKRTSAKDQDFATLVKELQQDLSQRYSDYFEKFAGHYYLDENALVVIAYIDNQLAGCAALRPIAHSNKVELKRMFVKNEYRRKGISKALLAELELWANELGYSSIQLETGRNQPEAIVLYEISGYHHYKPEIETWPESVFMEKLIK